jgi:hypothetical protein
MELKAFLFELNNLIGKLCPFDEILKNKFKELITILNNENDKEELHKLYLISDAWLCYNNIIIYLENQLNSFENEYKIKLTQTIKEYKIALDDIKNDWIKEYNFINNI